jgi:hypothetical protein
VKIMSSTILPCNCRSLLPRAKALIPGNDDTNDGGQSDPADSSDPGGGSGGGCFVSSCAMR